MQEVEENKQIRFHVKRLVAHLGAHLDEALQAVLIQLFGHTRFIGHDTAEIVEEDISVRSELECLLMGDVPLGQINGGIMNDKCHDGKRRPDTCSALRTAEFLSIPPGVEKILRNAVRVDQTRTALCTDISVVIKCGHRAMPRERHFEVFNWAVTGIHAMIAYAMAENKGVDTYVHPPNVFEVMVKEGEVADPRIVERLGHVLTQGQKRGENCLELSYIARAMKHQEMADEAVKAWLRLGIGYLVAQQQKFWQAVDEIKACGDRHKVEVAGKVLKLVRITTDNLETAAASRNEEVDAAIAIVRRTSDNVSIQFNGRHGINPVGVWALVRLHLTPVDLRGAARWDDYIKPGTHPQAPRVYMMQDGNVLNGSESHPMEPLELTDAELIKIVRDGLSPHAQKIFERMSGHSTQALPQPVARPQAPRRARRHHRHADQEPQRTPAQQQPQGASSPQRRDRSDRRNRHDRHQRRDRSREQRPRGPAAAEITTNLEGSLAGTEKLFAEVDAAVTTASATSTTTTS
jgi:hypothetical protein